MDRNAIRATIAETLETSDHTSVQCRIEATLSLRDLGSEPSAQEQNVEPEIPQVESAPTIKSDAGFLAPLSIDEAMGELGPCVNGTGKRASDKGFLPMTLVESLQLLD